MNTFLYILALLFLTFAVFMSKGLIAASVTISFGLFFLLALRFLVGK